MKRLLIVRHAERPDIPALNIGNDVELNDQGKRNSRLFGQKLIKPIISIKTSPIKRCRQTAEIIANEVDLLTTDINCSTMLGDPGFIIDNGEHAWEHWQRKGHDRVNEYLLIGKDKWQGFVDLDAAVHSICGIIKKLLMKSKKGTHIWITHDTILATLASRVQDKPLSLSQWPEFLGYLEVSLTNNNKLVFNYQIKDDLNRLE